MDSQQLTDLSHHFIALFQQGFTVLHDFSLYLLGTFLVIECFFLGVAWAFVRTVNFSEAFKKLLLVGFVVYLVMDFSAIVSALIEGFLWIGNLILQNPEATLSTDQSLIEMQKQPGALLQNGYEAGKSVLYRKGYKAWPNLFTMEGMLGIGLIFNFGLIAIRTIVVNVIFYAVAMMSLVFIPIGVYSPTKDFFYTSLRQLLIASVRVLSVFVIVLVLQDVWSKIDLTAMKGNPTLENWIGPYFLSLTFTFISFALPNALGVMVGRIEMGPSIRPTNADSDGFRERSLMATRQPMKFDPVANGNDTKTALQSASTAMYPNAFGQVAAMTSLTTTVGATPLTAQSVQNAPYQYLPTGLGNHNSSPKSNVIAPSSTNQVQSSSRAPTNSVDLSLTQGSVSRPNKERGSAPTITSDQQQVLYAVTEVVRQILQVNETQRQQTKQVRAASGVDQAND